MRFLPPHPVVALAAVLAAGTLSLRGAAQSSRYRGEAVPAASGGLRVRSQALARGGYAVLVDLDANRLYFAHGRRVLWSAPVGTGTGLRLESDRDAWDFHTPHGAFHVVYKEREPDWIAPDWYFLEHDLPVPGPNDPARRFTRGLGAAAVFIGQGLAIHGTDHPELLGRRVSHGCIRLADADALRLYHDVQVGTEVVIVGGDESVSEKPVPSARSSRPAGTPPPRDPVVVRLEGMDTDLLLSRLDDALVADAFAGEAEWPRIASVLLFRGVKEEDDAALAGLLTRVDGLGEGRLREEYGTFVADAFSQGPLRTLSVLGMLDAEARQSVAEAIVAAARGLYPGEDDDPGAPWPTRRVPSAALSGRAAQRGWNALRDAEESLRDRFGRSAFAAP